ncbi:hypothetical protein [Thalassoglobus polymorphus]|uniref:YHS domain protein n=1 Tax=Thalassoglobus polymorphus TaxID=2527994 RepID=A0A517QTL3_9PLAN|nr:hypothetical protein [Thalassoglobus polymorphus]QDT34942.1 hypothetical protein Mal48_42150 [Thalassoglobus polymorphus]
MKKMKRQKSNLRTVVCFSAVAMLAATWNFSFSDETVQANVARESLERLNGLIGEWRGTGQVRRGSTRGAWRQTGEFVWDFSKKTPAVKYVVNDGQLTESGLITWDENDKYRLELVDSKQQSKVYTGDWDDKRLSLTSPADDEGVRYRITITPLNEKRSLVLHEKTSAGGASFFRIAEVGYTRAGTRLAIPGGGKRECVVTGGTAQTAVTFEGETYYVCCSGCKQAFDDDPAGTIADFKARLKERAKKFNE